MATLLEDAVNQSLDHSISQIKLANIEKITSGLAMAASHEQLNIQRSPIEDSMFVNVGSSGSSDDSCLNPDVAIVTLPDSPRTNPVEERRVSGVSGSPSATGIKGGPVAYWGCRCSYGQHQPCKEDAERCQEECQGQ